jgi:hypothetical protein
VQRAFPAAPLDFCLCCMRLDQRGVGRDGDEGVQLGIELFNAAKTRFRQLHGRDLLAVDLLRCFGESEQREICIVGSRLSFAAGRTGADCDSRNQGPRRSGQSCRHKPPARQMRNPHAALPLRETPGRNEEECCEPPACQSLLTTLSCNSTRLIRRVSSCS